MWAVLVATVIAFGCVASQELLPADEVQEPLYQPGTPPELAPLDASDDIFQAGFLNDPNSHFTFVSRTNRLGVKPHVLQTDGNIQNYIRKRTRNFPSRFTAEPVQPITSTQRTRGTPQSSPPSPPPPPPVFVIAERKQEASQPDRVPPQISAHIKQQRFLAIRAMAEEVDRIRSRSEKSHVRHSAPTEAVQAETVESTTASVVRRRMPVKRRKVQEYEATTEQAATELHDDTRPRKKLPPLPIPTLSPWIDGYGK